MPDPSDGAEAALDDLTRRFDATFADPTKRVEDAALPRSRVPGDHRITALTIPPEATPEDRVCALGPCKHYSTLVVHLPTANEDESDDGIAHAEREHWCDYFKRNIGGEAIIDCNRWDPAVIGGELFAAHESRAHNLRNSKNARLANLQAAADATRTHTGFSPCRVCGKARERSGVVDPAARAAAPFVPDQWCLCGEKKVEVAV